MTTKNDTGLQANLKVKHLLAAKPNPVKPQTKKPVAHPKAASGAKTAPTTKPAAAKAEKKPRVSIRGTVKELVLKGLTNDAIWQVVQPKFAMADVQKYYVGWYRADLVRKGDVTKAQATPKATK
jgi:hypothetical protein